jgi:hypothetical protein
VRYASLGRKGRGTANLNLLLFLLGTTSFRFSTANADSLNFKRGDSNDDGNVDISDGVRTLRFLFLGEAAPPCLNAADVNDDGVLDLSDAVATFGFLFLGALIPPPPGHENCGEDPTPSNP